MKKENKTMPPKEDVPVYRWISLQRVAGGWIVLQSVSEGDKLVSVVVSEPDMKAIAMEKFKILAAKEYMS